ncbi:hypothetical protein JXJ21_22135 [candidate division KSB1 bacterium]|nr:hypothetical protein [candidate division KSB1 bacterium]
MYDQIITHNDFDGVVSAAICAHLYKVERILFAGPNTIARSELTITENDIVCDLPYPLECGLWFDHHEGNLDELKYRQMALDDIEGAFAPKPSCARVVFDYAQDNKLQMPDFFEEMVNEADIIDAFDYATIDEWRKETPGKIIDASIKARDDSPQSKNVYLRQLVSALSKQPIAEVSKMDSVRERFQKYSEEESEILQLISNSASFHPDDKSHEIVILDLTHHKRRPYIIKNLAYLLYPEALSVLEINCLFNRGIKTNNLAVSMSLSINLNAQPHQRDIGEIMRQLNIGDGHPGAAAGTVYCDSKDWMLREKQALLDEILEIWQKQA